MKKNDIHHMIDQLQGFDGDELQQGMTDGLDAWCRQRQQRTRSAKRAVLLALLLLTTTAIAMSALPLLRLAKNNDAKQQAADSGQRPPVSSKPMAENSQPTADTVVSRASVADIPVDYYYTGVAEDGYSVTYGHDSRTLTYTRYSGGHLIHSVIPNSPDIFLTDSTGADTDTAEVTLQGNDSIAKQATRAMVSCDFQTIDLHGDAFYYIIIDSVRRHVSLRGDVAQWMGQRIYYSDTLVLPDKVEYDGVIYNIVALADSAFAGHDELHVVVLPSSTHSIGDMAFAGCRGLTALTVPVALPPEAFPASFDRTDAGLTLTVPCGSKAAYGNDTEWMYFHNVVEDCLNFRDPRSPRIRVIRKE